MSELTLVIGNKTYSSWSLRAWLALSHTGQAFREVVIPLHHPETAVEIRRHSPAGRVPVLHDGAVSVWESLAIAEYLAERFPEPALWPADVEARAVARAVSNEMHAGFMALRAELPMDIHREYAGRSFSADASADIARVGEIWRDCRARFGAGGRFLFGAFSIADAMYAPVASRLRTYGVPLDVTCAAYVEAVWSLPILQTWVTAARAEPWVIDYPRL